MAGSSYQPVGDSRPPVSFPSQNKIDLIAAHLLLGPMSSMFSARHHLFRLLLALCLCYACPACLLCPLHIPVRPKPLDQFRLPSIQKLAQTAETFEWLCQNRSRLAQVSAACSAEVSHLFCSLTRLAHSLRTECPGPAEDQAGCAECRAQMGRLYSENKWTLTWVDSVGKMPSGISDGNFHWLGDYEQCQRLNHQQLYHGRYCLLEFSVPDAVPRPELCGRGADPLEVVLGICLPASCSAIETRQLVEYVADHRPIQVNCEPVHRLPLAGLLLVCLGLLWLALLLGVSLLLWLRPSLLLPAPLRALCLQTHLRHSLRTTRPPDSGSRCSPGLRVLSAALVVFGQSQVLVLPYLENTAQHYALLEHWLAQPLLNLTLFLDSLLVLSSFHLGLLASHGALSEVATLLWRRFLRHWPSLALLTLGMTFVFAWLGEGPMWHRTDIARRCQASWPENLLLVQNVLGHSHTCLDAAHLLALEAQCLLAGLAFLWLFPRRPQLVLGSLLALVTLSVLFPALVSVGLGIHPPTLLPHRPMDSRLFGPLADLLVLNPLARVGPPLLGLLCGLWLWPRLSAWTHLLRALAPLCCLLLLAPLCLLLWAPSWLSSTASPLSLWLGALYAGLHRLAWALLLLALLLLAESAKGGVIPRFLRWRVWHPLSKLLYSVLLLSEPIALSFFASLHRPVHATPLSSVLVFLGVLVCSFLLAFLLDISLTRPICQLCGQGWWRKARSSAGPEAAEKEGKEKEEEEHHQLDQQ